MHGNVRNSILSPDHDNCNKLSLIPMSKVDNSSDQLVEVFLDDKTLKRISKCDDLTSVRAIEFSIDVTKYSAVDIGGHLPNLRHLKLFNSLVPAIRDLGSSLSKLHILSMSRCGLTKLDGISSLPCLAEAYLSFNEIEDLSPCSLLEKIEIFDLESNRIKDKKTITYLKTCGRLSSLCLYGNPLTDYFGASKAYRKYVSKILPQLKILDDVAVGKSLTLTKSTEYDITHFEHDWDYINNVLQEIGLVALKESVTSVERNSKIGDDLFAPIKQSTIQPGRCGQGIRPRTAKHQSSSNTTQFSLPISELHETINIEQRPSTSSSLMDEVEGGSEIDETASDLTTGQVICGDIGRALRRRRGRTTGSSSSSGLNTPNAVDSNDHQTATSIRQLKEKFHLNNVSVKPNSGKIKARPVDSVLEGILAEEKQLKVQCGEVMKELAAWRKQQSKNHKLFQSPNPGTQILTIDHTEAGGDLVLLSHDSDSTLEECTPKSPGNVSPKSEGVASPAESATCEREKDERVEKQSDGILDAHPVNSDSKNDQSVGKTSPSLKDGLPSIRNAQIRTTKSKSQPQLPKITTSQGHSDTVKKPNGAVTRNQPNGSKPVQNNRQLIKPTIHSSPKENPSLPAGNRLLGTLGPTQPGSRMIRKNTLAPNPKSR